jgi:hypothetical protein
VQINIFLKCTKSRIGGVAHLSKKGATQSWVSGVAPFLDKCAIRFYSRMFLEIHLLCKKDLGMIKIWYKMI